MSARDAPDRTQPPTMTGMDRDYPVQTRVLRVWRAECSVQRKEAVRLCQNCDARPCLDCDVTSCLDCDVTSCLECDVRHDCDEDLFALMTSHALMTSRDSHGVGSRPIAVCVALTQMTVYCAFSPGSVCCWDDHGNMIICLVAVARSNIYYILEVFIWIISRRQESKEST